MTELEHALGGANWITSTAWRETPDDLLPALGTTFHVEGASSARLAVASGGVYDIRVNGRSVTPHVLEPGYSDYSRIIEYTIYDISEFLIDGLNTLVVELGPGMYKSHLLSDRWVKITSEHGELGIRAAIEITTVGAVSTIITDDTWRASAGATLRSSWTGGEDFVAARAFTDTPATVQSWPPAVMATVAPQARLAPRGSTPLAIVETLPAIAVTEPTPLTYVVDFGINFAGWCEVTVPAHTTVRLRPAELLNADGTVNVITEGWGPVFHTVESADASVVWHPRFMYNGFRYLEVSGLTSLPSLDWFRGLVIAADVATTGSFASSNGMLNAIDRITRRAITSNMFSVFTDCPHREKLGYLEQLHLVFDILVHNYAARPILENTLELTVGALRDDGSIGLYVPEWEVFDEPWRGDINFGGAIGFLPWQLYTYFGDDMVLRDNFDSLSRYIGFLQSRLVDGILADGLGDWDGREFRAVPVVASATMHGLLVVSARIAETIERHDQATAWREDARALRDSFLARFTTASGYGAGSLAENVLALRHGLVPEEKIVELVDLCERAIVSDEYFVDVGEIGMSALVHVLSQHDRHETLFRLTQGTERPGYGYMIAHDATALTETWDGPTYGYSQNHFMNGSIVTWFRQHVVGIAQADASIGFAEVRLRPRPCGDLSWAEGHFDSMAGTIALRWSIEDGQFVASGSVPESTRATIELPSGTVTELAPGPFSVREAY